MKIAVVGSGIAGLACAWRLARNGQDVSLFEAGDYFGGHTHTVDVTLEGKTWGVDTGFLVFNHRTYPNLVKLFDELGVQTTPTDMSFSVKLPVGGHENGRSLEWAGTNLASVFVQKRNLANPDFLRMLADILRFNRAATRLATAPSGAADAGSLRRPLGDYLDAHGYSAAFRDWYLLPMAGCIWSCPIETMLAFPLASFVRFCHNHGLLQVSNRPQWHTVTGGARHYVDKILPAIPRTYLNTPVTAVTRASNSAKVMLHTAGGAEAYDHVVLACHADQALALLRDPLAAEARILGAVAYQPNRAVLHTDRSCLPHDRRAWAAWNYQSAGSAAGREPRVCVHYLLNKLQPLPFETPLIVSLNPLEKPAPGTVLGEFDYAHPVFDLDAVAAQTQLAMIQGSRNIWYAGAWTGYGFHEDGLKSGMAVAESLLAADPSLQAAA